MEGAFLMNENWNKFKKTGKIEDYLEYKRKQKESQNGKDIDRRDHPKINRV